MRAQMHCLQRLHPLSCALVQFHAVFDVALPGLLGDLVAFRRQYELPIQRGRDADALESEVGGDAAEEWQGTP